jgi:hypothetical protein
MRYPKATSRTKPPAWHKIVLQKRLAKTEAGKGEFLTIAQLKQRLGLYTN